MRKMMVSTMSAMLMLAMVFSTSVLAVDNEVTTAEEIGVTYRTHVQYVGWETNWAKNGDVAGTEGQSLRLEGVQIKLLGESLPEGAGIEYRTHVQNVGWETTWAKNGTSAGTEGKSLRLEGIQIRLLNMPANYSVQYRTHVQNVGWETEWAKDGETAGTEGKSYRLEGLEVKIVKLSADLTAYNAALVAATQADYTAGSWAVYQTIVAANVVTVDNLQTEVDTATANIIEAQKNLVRLADLTNYNIAVAAVTEDQVKSGWTAYKAVLDANVMTNQNTQVQVDAATAAILAAQKNLVLYANMTAFNQAIALYVSYGADANNTPYTTATWDAYTAQCELYGTLTEGKWVYDSISKNNSQATVDAATVNINKYIAKLANAADLTAFNAAKAIKISDGPYTSASFTAYTNDARVKAITDIPITTLKGYTQAVVDGYKNTLLALQQELLVKGSDLTAYNAMLAKVKQADYTTVSWAAYQVVVTANVVTADNTQAKVDAATAVINAAQEDLILSSAYIAANAKIDSAHFEVQNVGDNIITRANELITAAGFDASKYAITFTRMDNGTAKIDASFGLISGIGDGTAIVTFTITPIDGAAATTTATVVLVLS